MSGLPASGKSTLAEELITERGNTVRINKDLLRTMLHFDKFSGVNEGLTQEASKILADYFLSKNINVIIDDTNLNPRTIQSYIDLAKQHDYKIEYKDVDTNVNVCIERDEERQKKVGHTVIKKMALQYKNLWKGEDAVICDLDGTLCNIEHRLKYARGEEKDWTKFFELIPNDKLRHDVRTQVLTQSIGKRLILVSARPENYRKETELWLENNGIGYDLLIMRNADDKRDDTIVKSEIYDKYLSKLNITYVYDDRPKVIRMWREKGLNVIDVGNGIEF